MTASTSNAQSSALFNLSNLSERLRGAAQAAAGEKGFKAGLKEALAKSPFLALSYFVLSVPFEIMINKTIKPTISKLYKKFKRDENAEPPEIAQSLFSALRTFVWFPAVFVGDFLYHIVNGNTTNPQNSSINQNSAQSNTTNSVEKSVTSGNEKKSESCCACSKVQALAQEGTNNSEIKRG